MSYRVATLAGLVPATALAGGCQGTNELDCVERLVWEGREYGGLRHRPPLGEELGRTATLGCQGERLNQVTIFRIRGVSPSVAIAVRANARRRYVGLGPGYIVESPRHPLHRAAFGADDKPDANKDQVCHRPRVVFARAARTPVYDAKSLTVAAEGRAVRLYLRGRGVRGLLSFDAGSVIEGLDRGGVPHIAAGDRLRLVLRACKYRPGAPPGLRGLDKLVVVRVEPTRR